MVARTRRCRNGSKKSQQDAEEAAQNYADAQDNLKETQLKAYADGIVSEEEERAISDAESKLQEAKSHAENVKCSTNSSRRICGY